MKTPFRPTRWLSGPFVLATAVAFTLQTPLAADTFGSGANQFDMDFVPVGNPADTAGPPDPVGSVAYGYRMGTYEVSRDMITKANAPVVDGGGNLGVTMADMSSYGGNGVNRPATGLSWYETAKVVNWLNESTGHQPAYNLVGASLSLWPPGDAWQAGGENLYRHKDAYYFLPSEQEWYKAAYYDPNKPGGAGYWHYPTGSDLAPTAVTGGTTAGTAVYGQDFPGSPADIGNAGGLSPSGTMGQGGNAWEWMESAYDLVNDSDSEARGLRGGNWLNAGSGLASGGRGYYDPPNEGDDVGFRVAAVPEPSPGVLLAVGLSAGSLLRRRRGSV